MTDSNIVDRHEVKIIEEEFEKFRKTQILTNHWARPAGRPAYYWYLTFDDFAGLHDLAVRAQAAISSPYYDLTPSSDLHLTLDRIGFQDEVSGSDLNRIEAAASRACREIAPFDITIGALGGTPGAIGFTAYPDRPIRDLREELRVATFSAFPSAQVKGTFFHAHVAIAYCNSSDIPAANTVAAVERIRAAASIAATITEVALVSLRRQPQSYEWATVLRIPLTGTRHGRRQPGR